MVLTRCFSGERFVVRCCIRADRRSRSSLVIDRKANLPLEYIGLETVELRSVMGNVSRRTS